MRLGLQHIELPLTVLLRRYGIESKLDDANPDPGQKSSDALNNRHQA